MNNFWKNLKTTNERIEIHCKTEKEAEDFCKNADEQGFYRGPKVYGTHWQLIGPESTERGIYYTIDPSAKYIDFEGVHNPDITSTVEWSDYMPEQEKESALDNEPEMDL